MSLFQRKYMPKLEAGKCLAPHVQWTARNPGQWDGDPWLPDLAGPCET